VRGVGRARAASPGLAMRLSSRLSAAGTDGRVAEAVVFGFWFEGVRRREGGSERASERWGMEVRVLFVMGALRPASAAGRWAKKRGRWLALAGEEGGKWGERGKVGRGALLLLL
jgi:hypothetical protein